MTIPGSETRASTGYSPTQHSSRGEMLVRSPFQRVELKLDLVWIPQLDHVAEGAGWLDLRVLDPFSIQADRPSLEVPELDL